MDDFVASMIYNNMMDTQYKLMYRMIKDAGLWDQFVDFSTKYPLCTEEVFKEFGKLHPDKFYVPDEDKSYGDFVILNERVSDG